MTETSNLARQFGDPAKSIITNVLATLIEPMNEIYIRSEKAIKRAEFTRLGLADAVILDALRPSYTLLTTDRDLYVTALRQGHNAVNFNYYRDEHLR